jgi:hypothetical protein
MWQPGYSSYHTSPHIPCSQSGKLELSSGKQPSVGYHGQHCSCLPLPCVQIDPTLHPSVFLPGGMKSQIIGGDVVERGASEWVAGPSASLQDRLQLGLSSWVQVSPEPLL